MNARVGNEVGLKLGQVDVKRAVETERRGNGGDDLADEAVEVGVRRTLDVKIATADVVDGLVVDHEGAVGVLERRVCRQDRVVGLDDGRADLRSGIDREFELGLLAVVDAEAFHEQGGEPGSRPATKRVENEKSLKPGTLIGLEDNHAHSYLGRRLMRN